jgi:uncharacterized circularly permuted ATP-grasp superfamily protein
MRLAAALALVLIGCAGPMSRADAAFARGDYPAARRELASCEEESASWTARDRARYALRRGLTHAALGDRREGARWLEEARLIEEHAPGTLTRDEWRRLELGLEQIEPREPNDP